MCMIRPSFLSPAERRELEACVRRQREDHGIARRANALLLLDDGESCTQIAKFLYLYRAYAKTRKFSWVVMRKLSDTLSRKFFHSFGIVSRKNARMAAANCFWLG